MDNERRMSSLAAKAIRASSAHRDSFLSSAYSSPPKEVKQPPMKQSFWGSLAGKAKAVLDEDDPSFSAKDTARKIDNPSLQRSLDAITSSLNYIGTAVEGGITAVENRTAGIIQETRRKIKKKPTLSRDPEIQADLEIQLKASRDVAMAMAAKAKLLLREMKMVKSDLAFAKQRCAQLEEENKVLRENRNGGNNQIDDDELVRLQLETLLAEKARLAHDNSKYARENLYLRGVVEYHQLCMQDVVYFDEKNEQVTEVYPINVPTMSSSSDISHAPPNTKFLELK